MNVFVDISTSVINKLGLRRFKISDIVDMAEFVITNEVSEITTNNSKKIREGEIPEYLVRLAR